MSRSIVPNLNSGQSVTACVPSCRIRRMRFYLHFDVALSGASSSQRLWGNIVNLGYSGFEIKQVCSVKVRSRTKLDNNNFVFS